MMIPYLWRTSRAGQLWRGSQQPEDQMCVWKHSEHFSPRPRAPCFPAAISPGTRALTLQTLEEQVPLTSRLSWPPGSAAVTVSCLSRVSLGQGSDLSGITTHNNLQCFSQMLSAPPGDKLYDTSGSSYSFSPYRLSPLDSGHLLLVTWQLLSKHLLKHWRWQILFLFDLCY